MALKILACGDVNGQFEAFFKRLNTVNKKAGPFEMAICVGSFFGHENKSWEEYLSGKAKAPIPVYILGPNCQEELQYYSDLNGYELCENVIYLGQNGCFTTKEGLKIAYFSGKNGQEKANYNVTYEHYKSMEVQMKWFNSNYTGVDILMTSEWPKGICTFVSEPDGYSEDIGSTVVSKLAVNIRPRYHFAGLHGIHYERLPYRNHRVMNEATRHVTRFIGLGKVGNPEKKKWLYAFNVVPIPKMDRKELTIQPSDVTEVPFKPVHLHVEEGPRGQNQFFYDMNAKMDDEGGNRKRRRNDDGDFQQKRPPPKPTGPCWFCLSGSEVEKHLVVSIGDHSYMALPKGGLVPEHVLILPIAHHASSLEIPEEVAEEIEKFKTALRKCFKKAGKAVVFFERNYKSQHLQLQAVPIPLDLSDQVKSVIAECAESYEFAMDDVPEHATLTQMAEPGTPFFFAETPLKERLFHRVRRGFPIQFGRECLASPSLLNIPEKIDWKECQVSKQEEAEMTKNFRDMFKEFDFTLE